MDDYWKYLYNYLQDDTVDHCRIWKNSNLHSNIFKNLIIKSKNKPYQIVKRNKIPCNADISKRIIYCFAVNANLHLNGINISMSVNYIIDLLFTSIENLISIFRFEKKHHCVIYKYK